MNLTKQLNVTRTLYCSGTSVWNKDRRKQRTQSVTWQHCLQLSFRCLSPPSLLLNWDRPNRLSRAATTTAHHKRSTMYLLFKELINLVFSCHLVTVKCIWWQFVVAIKGTAFKDISAFASASSCRNYCIFKKLNPFPELSSIPAFVFLTGCLTSLLAEEAIGCRSCGV